MRFAFRQEEPNWLRHMTDLLVCFLLAIMMLRGFFLEGYLISTGSMAPRLRGLHQQLVCPTCGNEFAFGVSFDESVGTQELPSRYACCPNCGQQINAGGVPKAHGDQLLVHKGVFETRDPDRWESVVFRNPAQPDEAYVKRAVGLPNEQFQVVDGDVHIDGQIVRKDLDTAFSTSILVYDSHHQPADKNNWKLPWDISSNWVTEGNRFFLNGNSQSSTGAIAFRNWRRFGGHHASEVATVDSRWDQDWNTCVSYCNRKRYAWLQVFKYDPSRHTLSLTGVMPYEMQSELSALNVSESFRTALSRLAALSHLAPLTDLYGYNGRVYAQENVVRDLRLSVQLRLFDIPKRLEFQMPIESQVVSLVFSPVSQKVQVLTGSGDVLAEQRCDLMNLTDEHGLLTLDLLNYDHRLQIAVNESLLLPPIDFRYFQRKRLIDGSAAERFQQATHDYRWQSSLSFSVQAAKAEIRHLQLYRDVFYTSGQRVNGVTKPIQIPAGHFFVMGDNSPVSSDSRSWEQPFVPRRLLIGKPFVVHLPSRPGAMTKGRFSIPVRIPDWSRIRYIR